MLFVLRVVNGEELAGLVFVVGFLELIDLINRLAAVVLEFLDGVVADFDGGDIAFDKLLRLHGLTGSY